MTTFQIVLIIALLISNLLIVYWDFRITRMNRTLACLVHGLATGEIKVKEIEG